MKIDKNVIKLLKKSFCYIAKAILGISILIAFYGLFYWYNNRLFLWEAELIWPQETFVESKFKTGSTKERSKMVVDLIRSKRLLGVNSEKISEMLGPETGDYYYTDSNFTYELTDRGDADWILTLVTGGNGKIEKIFIRKSCCSISKRILYWAMEASEPLLRSLAY